MQITRSKPIARDTQMGMVWNIVRIAVVAITVVVVAEVSKRYPRYGALLLSLPIVSILAFLVSWFQHRDLPAVSRLARETLILVPLGLPFFVPFALATRLGIGFWQCFILERLTKRPFPQLSAITACPICGVDVNAATHSLVLRKSPSF